MRLCIGVVMVFIVTILLPTGTSPVYEYEVGSIWTDDDVIAPYAFPIYREQSLYELERRAAIDSTIRSFDRVDSVQRTVADKSRRFFDYIRRACDVEIGVQEMTISRTVAQTLHDSLKAALIPDVVSLNVTPNDWRLLIALKKYPPTQRASSPDITELRRFIDQHASSILHAGYIDQRISEFLRPLLAIQEGKQERVRSLEQVFDREKALRHVRQQFLATYSGGDSLASTVEHIARALLQPNILLNRERTQIAIDWNVDRVPRTMGIIKENERIISKHERVTAEIKLKLDSYQRSKIERGGKTNLILLTIGKIGHVCTILFLLALYLYHFRKRIFFDNARLAAIAILILLEALLANIMYQISSPLPLEFLIVIPAAAMLMTIMFDSRVGIMGTVAAALIVAAVHGNDYELMLASLTAGALGVFSVRDMKNRAFIFRSVVFIFLAYAFTICVLGFQRYEDAHTIAQRILLALGNAIISPVLTYGLLVFFERVFGITTDMTLLELSDFNHPLLRTLSTQAPGTFHHSIVMGTLAEAAAKSIGANPILARVGAYYHDIGKIVEPEFFVENQLGTSNIHDTITPHESTKHILNHVYQGIELAKEHKLPQRIIDFIPAHHGKTIVTYFFEKERRKNPEVESEDFTYPGPRPQTKETAIVMLADSIEAAARSIEDPTIEKIDKLIEEVIRKRLSHGELDECTLTMRDLGEIRRSFLSILTGIHHSRIRYPSEEEAEAAQRNAERTAKLLRLPSNVDALAKRIKRIDAS